MAKTMARNRTRERKRQRKKEGQLRVTCWNVRSFSGKDQEIIMELAEHRIDICSISETKKRGKGTSEYNEYIFAYSGKPKDSRAASGVGILINSRLANDITNIEYKNDRIMTVSINLKKTMLHIISVYAPDAGRPDQEAIDFYDQLQSTIDKTPHQDNIMILGDMNARIGDEIIAGVKNRFNEKTLNDRDEMLIEFCTHNELRINNTFFKHKPQHKITFHGNREATSTIDYIIINRTIKPEQILDVRALTSANIGSDHNLLLGKLGMSKRIYKGKNTEQARYKFNIESLRNENTQGLYERRLAQKIEDAPSSERETTDTKWSKLKSNIHQAAEEALGKRIIKSSPHRNTKPWFTSEVKALAKEKKNAHLKYRSTKLGSDYTNYIEVRNRANKKTRKIKKEYWESFSREMESDLYGTQKRVWKMLRASRKEINETVQINNITAEKWTTHFKELYAENNNNMTGNNTGRHRLRRQTALSNTEIEPITVARIRSEIRKLKTEKLQVRTTSGMNC